MIEETINVINNIPDKRTVHDLQGEYPVLVFIEKLHQPIGLIHLATHLTHHLGQINYHRRLLDMQTFQN